MHTDKQLRSIENQLPRLVSRLARIEAERDTLLPCRARDKLIDQCGRVKGKILYFESVLAQYPYRR